MRGTLPFTIAVLGLLPTKTRGAMIGPFLIGREQSASYTASSDRPTLAS